MTKARTSRSSIPSPPRWARRRPWSTPRIGPGRFFDGIEYRGYDQKVVEGLAANAGVPVWNGLTDVDHPTQALADILTLMENTKSPSTVQLVFCGDTRNNVAYCLMYICAKLGMHYVGWGPGEPAPPLKS